MARFFMGGKVYDTEKAEEVARFRRSFPSSLIQGIYFRKDMTLYRTERGNWFSVSKEDYGEQAGHLETEESVYGYRLPREEGKWNV